ncbi:MAG: hypothetical protein ACR2L3_03550, partial [Actinomycetota bacterium]
EPAPDAEAIYSNVLEEQLAKGSSRQVAEARAKVAQAKAAKGIRRGPTPIEVAKPVPSATPKGHDEPAPEVKPADEPAPLDVEPRPLPPDIGEEEEGALVDPGAPPDTGETAPDKVTEKVADEPQSGDEPTQASPDASAGGDESPQAIYDRVYAAEKAKGSSEAVANGRAKAAQRKAEKAGG